MSCSVSESLISDVVLQLTLKTCLFTNILASEYWELYRDAPGRNICYLVLVTLCQYSVKCLDTIKPDWFRFLFYLRIYMTVIMIASGIFINKIPADLRNLGLFICSSSLEIKAVHFCISAKVSRALLFARPMEQKKKKKRQCYCWETERNSKGTVLCLFFLLICIQRLNYPEKDH